MEAKDIRMTAKPCSCDFCGESFASKTKLFKHLENVHGFEGPNTKPEKVIVLVGWLASFEEDTNDWAPGLDSGQNRSQPIDRVEEALYRALYALDNGLVSVTDIPGDVVIERPKGTSRASSVMQRTSQLLQMEPTCHAQSDTFCLNLKRYSGPDGDDGWVSAMNRLLPSTMRVLHRYSLSSMPAAGEFHAEVNCSQYRYEYMLPLRCIMPPDAAVLPKEKIVRTKVFHKPKAKARGVTPGTAAQQSTGTINTSSTASTATAAEQLQQRQKEHVEQNMSDFMLGVSTMDNSFPLDTNEGQARVAFFRKLKRVLKIINGRHPFHNFATGGASPEDTASVRKVDRIYHKELVCYRGEPWVVFSVSGDAFLRGQVRHLLGLAVAMTRGLLPETYLQSSVRRDTVVQVPALPGWGLYLAECRYAFYEAKFSDFRLDPRRIAGADCGRMEQWRIAVQTHIAQLAATQVRGDHAEWMAAFEQQCRDAWRHFSAIDALAQRTREDLEAAFMQRFQRDATAHSQADVATKERYTIYETDLTSTISNDANNRSNYTSSKDGSIAIVRNNNHDSSSNVIVKEDVAATAATAMNTTATAINTTATAARVPAVYRRVLRLLREADASGLWPVNSTGRQKVIVNAGAAHTAGTGSRNPAPAPAASSSSSPSTLVLADGSITSTKDLNNNNDSSNNGNSTSGDSGVGEGTKTTLASPAVDESSGSSGNRGKHAAAAPRTNTSDKKGKGKGMAVPTRRQQGQPTTTSSSDCTEKRKREESGHQSSKKENKSALTAAEEPEKEREEKEEGKIGGEATVEDAVVLVSDAGVGGSFSVGALPKHMQQPRGNDIFPELMRACFELERALCPHRPHSGTIAVNRHAQFSPHRDSGAGNGQSPSLIVALGDFAGGEIAVEHAAHDIRYRPLEFNGWTERHWTLPFVGERYSLVWFTPLGVTAEDLWWWEDDAITCSNNNSAKTNTVE